MLKKTITYNDLDGNPVTEDFYFQLNKAELAELELSHEGGLSEYLKTIIATNNGAVIMSTFKGIITSAVGRRSEDGRRFVKSQEIIDDFVQSEAYSEMFMELVTDATAAAGFIRGIVPAGVADKMEAGERVTNLSLPQGDGQPAWIVENRNPTSEEIKSMTQEQLQEAFRRKNATP